MLALLVSTPTEIFLTEDYHHKRDEHNSKCNCPGCNEDPDKVIVILIILHTIASTSTTATLTNNLTTATQRARMHRLHVVVDDHNHSLAPAPHYVKPSSYATPISVAAVRARLYSRSAARSSRSARSRLCFAASAIATA